MAKNVSEERAGKGEPRSALRRYKLAIYNKQGWKKPCPCVHVAFICFYSCAPRDDKIAINDTRTETRRSPSVCRMAVVSDWRPTAGRPLDQSKRTNDTLTRFTNCTYVNVMSLQRISATAELPCLQCKFWVFWVVNIYTTHRLAGGILDCNATDPLIPWTGAQFGWRATRQFFAELIK